MALRWMESFGLYGVGGTQAMKANWAMQSTDTANNTISNEGRAGGPCFKMLPRSGCSINRGFGGRLDQVVVGFAHKMVVGDDRRSYAICDFFDTPSGRWQCQLYYFADSGLLAMRRNQYVSLAVLGLSPVILQEGVWNYIEVKFKPHDTAGLMEVRINGALLMSFAGNTQWAADPLVDSINLYQGFSPYGGYTNFIADMVCLDTTGPAPLNDYLGDCRVDCLLPNADTRTLEFTPSAGTDHWSLVNQTPPDDDASFVASATAGARDLYQLSNMVLDPHVTPIHIFGVSSSVRSRKDNVGTRTLRPIIKSGSTQANGAAFAPGLNYGSTSSVFPTDPDTGAEWTKAGIDALQTGVEILT